MKIKATYITSGLRIVLNKIKLGKRLRLYSIMQFFGRSIEINASADSTIIIGKKNYFSNYVKIGAFNNATLSFGQNNFFNRNVLIVCLNNITIGSNNLFGPNVVIVDHNHKYDDPNKLICKQGYTSAPITIGSNIWISGNVTICQGVTIVDRVVIGANSVVSKDCNEPGVYVGIPAKKIRDI